ncbi:VOC family protein [bacterium]|nr:VOC family protein [bacterium]
MRFFVSALLALMLLCSLAGAQEGDAPMPEWNPQAGQVVHIEIPSLDLDQSAAFYGDVFGWTAMPGPEGMDYMFWSDGGTAMGGFTGDGKPNPDGGVVFYIYSESIADSYAAIEAAGGKSTGMELYVGEGYIGMFHDPSGNLIGLFSSNQSMPAMEEETEAADPHAGHNH